MIQYSMTGSEDAGLKLCSTNLSQIDKTDHSHHIQPRQVECDHSGQFDLCPIPLLASPSTVALTQE
jgi:hypothetical protein